MASLAGDAAFVWGGAAAANNIETLQADGFEVGTHARVNTSGGTYYYLAIEDPGP